MARGLVSGLLVGGVVSVTALGVASVLSPLPDSPNIENAPGGVTAPAAGGGQGGTEQSGTAPRGKDADLVEIAPTAPAEQSESDDLNAMGDADTDPAARPAVEAETAGLGQPSAAGQSPSVPEGPSGSGQVAQSEPNLPKPQPSDAPISNVPAQPSAPEVKETGSGFGDAGASQTAPAEAAAEGEANEDQANEDQANEDQASTDQASTDQAATQPEAQPGIAEPAQPPAPRLAALPQSGSEADTSTSGPTVGTPVRPLTERDDPEPPQSADPVEPAIKAYAQAFEDPGDKPLMSIVLIDDAEGFGAEALQEFPYPLTFALDPADPDAIAKLDRYTAAGFEAALLTDLPPAATAQDAEVAMQAAMAALPSVVALVEGVGSGFQGNRALSEQVTTIALAGGHGLVTQSNGLNTVQKLAVRRGVPSAVVFRDFDGAGQSPDTIRRFLDQAAFRADQEGAVVMLGRVRPETISALLLWGLQDRASRVALVPLSGALLHGQDG